MHFNDYAYQRPDLDAFKQQMTALLQEMKAAPSLDTQWAAIEKIAKLRSDFDSMQSICSIRHSIDTNDVFYKEENHFFDTHSPELTEYINDYYRLLLASPYRAELEMRLGKQIFVIAELSLKTFEPIILDDVVKENQLSTSYAEIKAQAQIIFRDKKYNLSTITPLLQDKDRTTRKEATVAKWNFYAENAHRIEPIYDQLVKNRHQQAVKLGYKNYIGLGYARMQRSDYDAKMVADFRQQIVEHVVPVATYLTKRHAHRLGLDALLYHDESYEYPSGNPRPKGGVDWQVEQASKMYAELSKETDEFFRFMTDRQLMDLASKNGKETGGYCAFIDSYKSPFIFSNFNGTSGDVEVLTHEAGHAFQCYATSRNTDVYEYLWPTYEACEIHSMSMEFFTWPWMDKFFAEDVKKFKFSHLAKAVKFLPYGCAVDEFQHVVYENPDMTPAERNAAWSAIEKKYLPHRNYDGIEFLEKGGLWQQQSHIFERPFYYIDYVLAQICAFQFWKRSIQGKDSAWQDYVRLCKAGGTKSFLPLVELAGLNSPFSPNCVREVMLPVHHFLESVDDAMF